MSAIRQHDETGLPSSIIDGVRAHDAASNAGRERAKFRAGAR